MIVKSVFSRLLIIAVVLWSGACLADQPASPSAPEAVVQTTTFHFGPVVDGTEIQHDFIIANRGEAPLDILKVRTA
jgi:hypothetical protein